MKNNQEVQFNRDFHMSLILMDPTLKITQQKKEGRLQLDVQEERRTVWSAIKIVFLQIIELLEEGALCITHESDLRLQILHSQIIKLLMEKI